MTKPSKFGEGKKGAEENLGDKFITIGQKDKWEGQEIEVKSDPLVDAGTGKPVIIRFFEYKVNSPAFRAVNPSNQEIFNSHAKEIKMFLWRDGLEPLEIMEPRIIRSKKKDGYRIVVTCQPKAGVALLEKPQTLQQLTQHGRQQTRRH